MGCPRTAMQFPGGLAASISLLSGGGAFERSGDGLEFESHPACPKSWDNLQRICRGLSLLRIPAQRVWLSGLCIAQQGWLALWLFAECKSERSSDHPLSSSPSASVRRAAEEDEPGCGTTGNMKEMSELKEKKPARNGLAGGKEKAEHRDGLGKAWDSSECICHCHFKVKQTIAEGNGCTCTLHMNTTGCHQPVS